MDIKNFIQSKTFRGILIGVGLTVVLLLVFQAGVFVGYKKASFSLGWGDNFHRAFGGRMHGGFMGVNTMRGDFLNSHGSAGKIIKIDLPTFIVEDRAGAEKEILIKNDTLIKKFRETIKPQDLKVNDEVVVIGSPDADSKVEAKLIRLMAPFEDTLKNENL